MTSLRWCTVILACCLVGLLQENLSTAAPVGTSTSQEIQHSDGGDDYSVGDGMDVFNAMDSGEEEAESSKESWNNDLAEGNDHTKYKKKEEPTENQVENSEQPTDKSLVEEETGDPKMSHDGEEQGANEETNDKEVIKTGTDSDDKAEHVSVMESTSEEDNADFELKKEEINSEIVENNGKILGESEGSGSNEQVDNPEVNIAQLGSVEDEEEEEVNVDADHKSAPIEHSNEVKSVEQLVNSAGEKSNEENVHSHEVDVGEKDTSHDVKIEEDSPVHEYHEENVASNEGHAKDDKGEPSASQEDHNNDGTSHEVYDKIDGTSVDDGKHDHDESGDVEEKENDEVGEHVLNVSHEEGSAVKSEENNEDEVIGVDETHEDENKGNESHEVYDKIDGTSVDNGKHDNHESGDIEENDNDEDGAHVLNVSHEEGSAVKSEENNEDEVLGVDETHEDESGEDVHTKNEDNAEKSDEVASVDSNEKNEDNAPAVHGHHEKDIDVSEEAKTDENGEDGTSEVYDHHEEKENDEGALEEHHDDEENSGENVAKSVEENVAKSNDDEDSALALHKDEDEKNEDDDVANSDENDETKSQEDNEHGGVALIGSDRDEKKDENNVGLVKSDEDDEENSHEKNEDSVAALLESNEDDKDTKSDGNEAKSTENDEGGDLTLLGNNEDEHDDEDEKNDEDNEDEKEDEDNIAKSDEHDDAKSNENNLVLHENNEDKKNNEGNIEKSDENEEVNSNEKDVGGARAMIEHDGDDNDDYDDDNKDEDEKNDEDNVGKSDEVDGVKSNENDENGAAKSDDNEGNVEKSEENDEEKSEENDEDDEAKLQENDATKSNEDDEDTSVAVHLHHKEDKSEEEKRDEDNIEKADENEDNNAEKADENEDDSEKHSEGDEDDNLLPFNYDKEKDHSDDNDEDSADKQNEYDKEMKATVEDIDNEDTTESNADDEDGVLSLVNISDFDKKDASDEKSRDLKEDDDHVNHEDETNKSGNSEEEEARIPANIEIYNSEEKEQPDTIVQFDHDLEENFPNEVKEEHGWTEDPSELDSDNVGSNHDTEGSGGVEDTTQQPEVKEPLNERRVVESVDAPPSENNSEEDNTADLQSENDPNTTQDSNAENESVPKILDPDDKEQDALGKDSVIITNKPESSQDTEDITGGDMLVHSAAGVGNISGSEGKKSDIMLKNDDDSINEPGLGSRSEDPGEAQSSVGSYVVLGAIMAIIVVLLGYSVIKSRRRNASETKTEDFGTEMADIKKTLLPGNEHNGSIKPKPHADDDESNIKLLPDTTNKDDNVENDKNHKADIEINMNGMQNGGTHDETDLQRQPSIDFDTIESQLEPLNSDKNPSRSQFPNDDTAVPEVRMQEGRRVLAQSARDKFLHMNTFRQLDTSEGVNGHSNMPEVVIEKPPSAHNGYVNGKSDALPEEYGVLQDPSSSPSSPTSRVKIVAKMDEDSVVKKPIIINREANGVTY